MTFHLRPQLTTGNAAPSSPRPRRALGRATHLRQSDANAHGVGRTRAANRVTRTVRLHSQRASLVDCEPPAKTVKPRESTDSFSEPPRAASRASSRQAPTAAHRFPHHAPTKLPPAACRRLLR